MSVGWPANVRRDNSTVKRGPLVGALLPLAALSAAAPAPGLAPRVAAPTATLHASAERIGWTGGSVSLTAVVRNGKSCQFFSVPTVAGIDGKVACGHGKLTRKGNVPAFGNGRSVQFELVVSGPNGMTATELTVHQLGKPAPSAKSHVIFRQSGSGAATTAAFVVPGNAAWTVNWSYANCTLGGGFNFDVYSGNLIDLNDPGPLDLNGSGAGAEDYFDSGVFYFQVITSCSWSFEVTDLVVTLPPTSTTSNVGASLSASVPDVDQNGGPLTLTANVHHGKLCTFLSDPPIAGLDGNASCSNGAVKRQGTVPADSATRTIYFEVVVTGATGLKAAGASILQRAPQTLLTANGSGPTTTGSFVIPSTDSQWTLTWSADCTSQLGGTGYIDVGVTNSISDSVDEVVTNTASGTSTFSDTGTFSLSISTPCNWTVSVSG